MRTVKILALTILLPFFASSQNFVWRKYVSAVKYGNGLTRIFELRKSNLIFGDGNFGNNGINNSFVHFDTSGTKVSQVDAEDYDSIPYLIYKNQNENYVGFFYRIVGLSYTGIHTRMLKYNNQFTAYQKYSFNDIDHYSLFGGMRGFFKFKNKHILLVGERGEPNYWNTLKPYWMKLDTSMNIIDQRNHDYQFFENPLSACWSSSGKIVNFSHGVYYYQTLDSMYFSSHTVDTAGEFSPKKKHMMPGINRKRDNDGFPTLKLSEIPSKDFLVSASYKKNGTEYDMSFFAIYDSTFTTLKKYKKIKRRIYVDVVPLKDGRFAAIEEEYNQFNMTNGLVFINFVVLDTGFNVVFSQKIKKPNSGPWGLTKYLFLNTKDVIFTDYKKDSLFFSRINNVGEPYIVEPYPPDSSFYLSKKSNQQESTQPALYPNPGAGTIWVQNMASGFHLSIYNQLGKCIIEDKHFTGPDINIQNYPRGIYHIRMEEAGKVSTFRYLKE